MQMPALLQLTVGEGHEQVLVLQTMPPVQALPHAPQFASFDVVSTQALLQSVRVPPHVAAHPPALHTCVDVHTSDGFVAPHAPQLVGLLDVSTQTPPQSVNGGTCVGQAQTPLAQTNPLGQTWPQDPQLFGSSVKRTHWPPQETLPFDTDASVLFCPEQPPATQAPPEQTSPLAHFTPHPPQLMTLTVVSTHTPPQSCCPLAQEHLPRLQVCPF